MENEEKMPKRNLIMYPLGTVGRDMVYQLFANFILTFILFTKGLNAAQIAAVTGIMIAARVFDALNDPIMGFIIEKTKTKWGKFKPWLALGVISTAIVVIIIFNSKLTGWGFVVEFGIIYFLYSITYTMHDISYWGMIPSLTSDANTRNKLTSTAILFAGIGGAILGLVVPMLTAGSNAIGGSTSAAYGIISIVVCTLSVIFICFTIFGVKENPKQIEAENKERTTLKKVVKTIVNNKPLLWVVIAFLIQQIGNGLVAGGLGSTYIYFRYGYEGGNYSLFSTIGLAATAILMVTYPMISKKVHRKSLMHIMVIVAAVGTALMLIAGLIIKNNTLSFWVLTIGYMLSNFGLYSFYLIMMISILNTVEYNEYHFGNRNEAVIASVRPFITKLASALIIGVTSITYLMFNVTSYTNKISQIEQDAQIAINNNPNLTEQITADKIAKIDNVIQNIDNGQKIGLLLAMTLIPFILMLISHFIYQKKYSLDEEEYDRICKELKERNTI